MEKYRSFTPRPLQITHTSWVGRRRPVRVKWRSAAVQLAPRLWRPAVYSGLGATPLGRGAPSFCLSLL
jgi:hypothetical protein